MWQGRTGALGGFWGIASPANEFRWLSHVYRLSIGEDVGGRGMIVSSGSQRDSESAFRAWRSCSEL